MKRLVLAIMALGSQTVVSFAGPPLTRNKEVSYVRLLLLNLSREKLSVQLRALDFGTRGLEMMRCFGARTNSAVIVPSKLPWNRFGELKRGIYWLGSPVSPVARDSIEWRESFFDKKDENGVASGPGNIVAPYFSIAAITEYYSNNIVFSKELAGAVGASYSWRVQKIQEYRLNTILFDKSPKQPFNAVYNINVSILQP